ncbi:MAG: hypothetical protein LBE56_06725 [Tannerella sp.]|jgi:hypothetical protein|nr:hypothetical protein [Tannerella sp.]
MEQDFFYDDDEAVKFIQNYLPQELKGKFSDDDINYIIDLMYEFYESKGFFDSENDDDEVVEFEEDEMIQFVFKNVKRDNVAQFTEEEIALIIRGELAYCDSKDFFE